MKILNAHPSNALACQMARVLKGEVKRPEGPSTRMWGSEDLWTSSIKIGEIADNKMDLLKG